MGRDCPQDSAGAGCLPKLRPRRRPAQDSAGCISSPHGPDQERLKQLPPVARQTLLIGWLRESRARPCGCPQPKQSPRKNQNSKTACFLEFGSSNLVLLLQLEQLAFCTGCAFSPRWPRSGIALQSPQGPLNIGNDTFAFLPDRHTVRGKNLQVFSQAFEFFQHFIDLSKRDMTSNRVLEEL